MYTIGETVFYSVHGVCIIEDIQDQTFSGTTKQYYVLRSHHDPSLRLFYQVEAENSKLSPVASKQKAELVLDTFGNPPSEWMERPQERAFLYQKVMESGNTIDIAQMVNTILRKKVELEADQKKLYLQDAQLLRQVSPILMEELAVSLGKTTDEVQKEIERLIEQPQ